MGNFINTILQPIEWIVAWIMYGWHQLFTAIGMNPASGATWGLSIVGLVIVMRAAMIPLFVKQIHASRRMQLIQPELQKIQKKYKGKNDPDSRQAMTQETMEVYKRTGTNPFSSCLPILLQSPFFFGLFRVLNGLEAIADGQRNPIGPITQSVARQAESASIFGAQLSDKFVGAETSSTKILAAVLIILMSASTFTTQRQLMMKNMPASALDNPFAKQQKLLLYIMPAFFAISGINFPIGVLIYWCVTNVWSMCQQFYVIRRMPAPGSPADKAMRERRERKGKTVKEITVKGVGASAGDDGSGPGASTQGKVSGQRQQPKGKKRAKATGGATPAGPDQGRSTENATPRDLAGESSPPPATPRSSSSSSSSTGDGRDQAPRNGAERPKGSSKKRRKKGPSSPGTTGARSRG
ncbi:Membrane protein oxaA [Nostocoides japonicum T1-X7]|uniref:Membrane protein insertase YidC n=1 Tax=Nostocoides japonicum T1-X7 TaxID=1194083 RepID=A0A077M1J3_9MICO|nr:membrane protein insertase YidC [Tetrasphaera japonica]CCH80163.1 Membrane protein oxaA [Tetrasphaera japonica T1-X7]